MFWGSRLGGATGVTLTGFSFEGEKPRVAFKQPNDSVILGSLHPEAGCGSGFLWVWKDRGSIDERKK